MTERNGNSSGEDGPEFTVEGPEMTRRSMLAGTAGLGFITSYDPTNAPNNVQAAQGKDGPSRSNEPISIGSRLQLFVDDYIISEMDSVEQRLHSPDPQDVAITFDEPWEGGGSSYITVFWDGEISRYRMYYRGAGIPPYGSFNERTCYAESEDGVNWEKPSLDLVEFNGSRDNNIILDKDPDSHNFQPFKDPNPDADPEAKYKAVGGTGELYALRSPDGIHWERVSDDRILAGKGAFDSQNVAFWDPVNEEYRAYFRYFDSGRRAIKTAVSDDFQNWTEVTELEYPDAPAEQLYINGINPYYRAPHIFLGFPGRYIERDWESNSMRKLPDWEFRQQRAETFSLRQGAALSDTLFMSSRDRETFRRWDRTFHRPGLWEDDSDKSWTYGTNWMAVGPVETPSLIDEKPNDISMYAIEGYWTPASRLRQYKIRIDGFVSMQAPLSGGEFTTETFQFEGDELVLNYATSAAGSIRVEIQNPSGQPYQGFSLEDSPEIFGDQIDRVVEYPGCRSVSELEGRPVQLRFVMSDADLYSFKFQDSLAERPEDLDPAAHYPLDEIQSDGTVLDASAKDNDGTNNGATIDDGIVDDALLLDSEQEWVDIDSIQVDDEVSVACWVNAESFESSSMLLHGAGERDPSSNTAFALYLNGNNPTWWMATDSDSGYKLARDPEIPGDAWVHLAGTYDGETLRLYVNGDFVASQNVPDEDFLGTGPCRIGADQRDPWLLQYLGHIDDMWVFDRAISETEIEALADRGDREPVAHYPLDEIQDDGTVLDASSNGNDGTNSGASVVNGVVGDALEFPDGSYVEIPSGSTLDVQLLTVAAWLDSVDGEKQYIFDGPNHEYYLKELDGTKRPELGVTVGGDLYRCVAPEDVSDEWSHVAGTYDGSEMRLYVDGQLVQTNSSPSGLIDTSSGRAFLGNVFTETYSYNGAIDDLHVYEAALSQEDICELVRRTEDD